jgi:hypothetical protein
MATKDKLNKTWDSTKEYVSENTGTIAGMTQIIAGLVSAESSKMPESNISDQMKNLSREVRQRAAYGLDPAAITVAENNIKNIQQNEIGLIKELSGGSVDVALSNVGKSTSRMHDALSSLYIKDAELKEQKMLNADNIMMKAIESDEREYERAYGRYMQNEDAISNMIGAGISNIVGESKLRKTNEQLNADLKSSNNVLKTIIENKQTATTPEEKAVKEEKGIDDILAPIINYNKSEEEILDENRLT